MKTELSCLDSFGIDAVDLPNYQLAVVVRAAPECDTKPGDVVVRNRINGETRVINLSRPTFIVSSGRWFVKPLAKGESVTFTVE